MQAISAACPESEVAVERVRVDKPKVCRRVSRKVQVPVDDCVVEDVATICIEYQLGTGGLVDRAEERCAQNVDRAAHTVDAVSGVGIEQTGDVQNAAAGRYQFAGIRRRHVSCKRQGAAVRRFRRPRVVVVVGIDQKCSASRIDRAIVGERRSTVILHHSAEAG